jgi:hypothetical protein
MGHNFSGVSGAAHLVGTAQGELTVKDYLRACKRLDPEGHVSRGVRLTASRDTSAAS